MKIRKESKDLSVISLESWRRQEKGERKSSSKSSSLPSRQFSIAGYVRLSPSSDEREEGSLVSHPQRIEKFVESKNLQHGGQWGQITDWYVDRDLSGKDMNRPEFQRMLADIKSGRINAIVVTELSRLNRKVKDFCEVYDFFKDHKVALFSLRENFDTSTAIGELMLIQAMSFAQYERQTIVDRIKRGARARAERGLANGYVPLGFRPVPHRPNYREVDEKEAIYVEMIFRKFLELKKLSPLLQHLNQNGYVTKEFVTKKGVKAGGNKWTISSLYSVLTNRAYIGEREINKHARGVRQSDLSEDDKYFFVDAHWPAIVSEDLFYDVQNLLEQNRKKARRYIHQYRLTGIIFCSECGEKLVGKSGTGRNGKYFYYGHKRKMTTKTERHLLRCRVENLPALILEETVVSRLSDLSKDKRLIASLIEAANVNSKEKSAHQKSLLATREQEKRRLKQKLENLYELISETDEKSVRLGLSKKASSLQLQLDQSEAEMETLKRDLDRPQNVVEANVAFKFLKEFRTLFEKQPIAVQTEILRDYIRRIVVREDGVAIVEIFGENPSSGFGLGGPRGACEGDFLITRRSPVRTDFKLVAGAGFEPTTFGL